MANQTAASTKIPYEVFKVIANLTISRGRSNCPVVYPSFRKFQKPVRMDACHSETQSSLRATLFAGSRNP